MVGTSSTTPCCERRLRIGVIAPSMPPEIGGGFYFCDSLVDAIKRHPSNHDFIIWDRRESRGGKPWKPLKETIMRTADADAVGVGRLLRAVARLLRAVARRLRAAARRLRAVVRWVESLWTPDATDLSQFEQFLRDFAIDVVWFLDPFDLTVSPSVPYIITVWDLQHRLQPYFPEVSGTWEALENHFLRSLPRASRIITGTQTGKDEIIAFYGVAPDNVIVVPLPTVAPESDSGLAKDPRAELATKYGITNEFLLYPAQFWPHKNHVNLLLALHQVRNEAGLALDLVLTGSDRGNLGHVKRVVASLDLSAQVHILGFVPRADLDRLYRAAFALTFPSFFGPDNLPPLEAFARNCPVTAACVSGAEDQLGNAALFFDPSDPADIARTILTLYRDRELRTALTRRGRALVAERTPAAYVARVCQILDGLASIRRCWATDDLPWR